VTGREELPVESMGVLGTSDWGGGGGGGCVLATVDESGGCF
jgi:hypothetical protein